MSDPSQPDPAPEQPAGGGPDRPDEARYLQLSARVPEAVARGVFSTGAIVIGGASEFVLDFVARIARPHMIVARVVMPHAVLPQVIAALNDNVAKFSQRFGPIPPLPRPEMEHRPSIQEVYDELKLSDDIVSGAYCNGVMISHTPAEFCFDFISNLFPKPAVSSRVFLSAPQVPRMLESLAQTYNEHVRRVASRRTPPRRDPPAAPGSGSANEPQDPFGNEPPDPASGGGGGGDPPASEPPS